MKRILPFLLAALLLATASAQATSGLSAVFEGLETTTESQTTENQITETKITENQITEQFEQNTAAHPVAFQTTAQQWMRDFQTAAKAQGLTLPGSFSYEPGMYTGQHSYDITIAETDLYTIGMTLFSDDGVNITLCSMRFASALLRTNELVQANDLLWRAAWAMIVASDLEATPEDIQALLDALCPDLSAALIRGERVEASSAREGIRYSLWAGFEMEAFFDESMVPSDGYIVDFVAEPDVMEGAE